MFFPCWCALRMTPRAVPWPEVAKPPVLQTVRICAFGGTELPHVPPSQSSCGGPLLRWPALLSRSLQGSNLRHARCDPEPKIGSPRSVGMRQAPLKLDRDWLPIERRAPFRKPPQFRSRAPPELPCPESPLPRLRTNAALSIPPSGGGCAGRAYGGDFPPISSGGW